MEARRWQRIEAIYHGVLERPVGDRAAFLKSECGDDAELLSEVESLLAKEGSSGGPIDRPAWEGADFAENSPSAAELPPGTEIGPYRITGILGAGGMGWVYQAYDARLGRSVAVKIAKARFDARFAREARAIAALNHPNICTIYDVGPNYLVMELVEGPTLADRIKKGPLPLSEALDVGRQIAEALEAAHEKGIVHRDLKPGNIKVRSDGTVKVLDFGLAKINAPIAAADGSPSVDLSATDAGMILGTAAYMAPEQARGEAVDERADIWAFGVILFELVTGQRLFYGDTLQETLLQVMTKDPDWTRVPARFAQLLRWCLEREPSRRLRDVGDAMLLLDQAPEPVSAAPRRWWIAWGAFVVAAAAALVVGLIHFRAAPSAPTDLIRFRVPLAPGVRPTGSGSFSLSPDGRFVAYVGIGSDGVNRLWIQALASLEATLLPDTEMYMGNTPPIWSPDGKYIAFYSQRQLKRTDLLGSTPHVICDVAGIVVGGSWNRDGVIIFGQDPGGLMKVAATGGTPARVTRVDPSRKEQNHVFPTFLPDGRHFIYTRTSSVEQYVGVFLGSLDDPADAKPSEPLLRIPVATARFVLQRNGSAKLFFIRNETLMVQDFDLSRFRLTGELEPVAEGVGFFRVLGFFDASPDVLVYRAAPAEHMQQLSWLDREGRLLGVVGSPINAGSNSPAISPGGDRAVIRIEVGRTFDLWLIDLTRGVQRRLTSGAFKSKDPAWSPDGTEIVFTSSGSGKFDLYRIPANGERREEVLYESTDPKDSPSWSPDRRFVLFTSRGAGGESGLWVLPLGGKAQPLWPARARADEDSGAFSPDGRWLAYVSHKSGASDIYVRPFLPPSVSVRAAPEFGLLVSAKGGTRPRWSGDGKEIFYRAADGNMMVAPVLPGANFRVGGVHALFQTPSEMWDVAPDGKRFLFGAPVTQGEPGPFTVVLNWQAGLRK